MCVNCVVLCNTSDISVSNDVSTSGIQNRFDKRFFKDVT
jgi:hypothetical protein